MDALAEVPPARKARFKVSWVLAGISLLLLAWSFVACQRHGWEAGQYWATVAVGAGVLGLFTHWPGRC